MIDIGGDVDFGKHDDDDDNGILERKAMKRKKKALDCRLGYVCRVAVLMIKIVRREP